MRKFFVSAFVLGAIFAFATSSYALEKTQARFTGDAPDDWVTSEETISISYYNICLGWVWVWSGFADSEMFGTVFNHGAGVLTGSYQYFPTGAPPGYGFTGWAVVNNVKGEKPHLEGLVWPAKAQIPFLPAGAGWEYIAWGVLIGEWKDSFAVSYCLQDDFGYGTPVNVYSDGPFACGVCFPTDRTTKSYLWGIAQKDVDGKPIYTENPGTPLFDGQCYVEWLAAVTLKKVISVDSESWGGIKSLYR
jgi:hypothetical protein